MNKDDHFDEDDFESIPETISEKTNATLTTFQAYFNGRLVRFLDHEDKLYVDTDDLHLLFEPPTQH